MDTHDPVSGFETYRRAVNPARLELLQSYGGPVAFSDAHGSWLKDTRGNRYLDFVCGYGTATLGHRHPQVTQALHEALTSSLPFTYPHSISTKAGELGSELCARAGRGLTKVYFGNSGAEGIEAALKFAMARTGRSKFLSFSEAFHGLTLGALSLAGAEHFRAPFPVVGLSTQQVAFEDLDYLEHCLRDRLIAGVVVELVQGMGGARAWKIEKLEELCALCHHYGTMLIIDEVLTGIGRTGKWFAFQHAGERFKPDIVVVAKGLSGGAIPVCAVLMTDEVFDSVYSGIGRSDIHASTFEGNLLAMVAGLTVIRIIEEYDLLNRITQLADGFRSRLTELQRQKIGITDVRVSGLLIGLQVTDDLYKGESLWGGAGCRFHLLNRGVFTNLALLAPSYINLTPAFTLSDSEFEWFFERLNQVLRDE